MFSREVQTVQNVCGCLQNVFILEIFGAESRGSDLGI